MIKIHTHILYCRLILSDRSNMQEVRIRDEYIKLEQAMKLAGAVSMGSEAKMVIQAGEVLVNSEVELRRGKKLRDGDIFTYENNDYRIVGA